MKYLCEILVGTVVLIYGLFFFFLKRSCDGYSIIAEYL